MAYTAPATLSPSLASRPLPVTSVLSDTQGTAATLTAGAIGATAAGTVIVTLTPGAGVWLIEAQYGFGATADADDNVKLNVDGTDVITRLQALPLANTLRIVSVVLTLTAGQAVALQLRVANTVAASIFKGQLVATMVR